MSTNIVIALDKRSKKSDGTFPLLMRIGHNRRTIAVPLGISLLEKDWDAKSRTVRNSFKGVSSVASLNNSISKKKMAAMDIILKLEEKGVLDTLSVAELKNRIYQPEANQSFFKYSDYLITELKKANRFGTARSYKGVVSVLKDFCGGKDLPFKQITYQFLCKFETNHLGKGNTVNGLSVYMRGIRAIFNKLLKKALLKEIVTLLLIIKSNLPQQINGRWNGRNSKISLNWKLNLVTSVLMPETISSQVL